MEITQLDRYDRLLLTRIERQFVKVSVSGKSEALRLFRKCKQHALKVHDSEKRKELLSKVLDHLEWTPSGTGISEMKFNANWICF
jgi:hypothetical protein